MTPQEQSAGYKIFHWKYQCKIPEMTVYSDAVLEHIGTYVSGDDGRDASNAMLMVGAVRTIAELAEIRGKGYKIELRDNKQAFDIYSIICRHLNDCIEFQRNGMFGAMPPIKDLELLDKLAAYIYPQARWHFVGEEDDSSRLMSFLSRNNRRGTKTAKTAPEAHTSIVTRIDASRLTGERKWK